jgi:hypothetical protein
MIVLDDPANFFSLIFSIRKIPNDLLDLERLNRPGESVPSRESRTSTLKGLFLLEGPAAAPCILTADFRCWPQAEVCAGGRHVGFSNRPFQVKHFQTIRHCNVDVAHGLALLRPAFSASSRHRCSSFSNALSSTASFFNGWRSTPGTIPATSQLDRLISMTVISVPSGSRAVRERSGRSTSAWGPL